MRLICLVLATLPLVAFSGCAPSPALKKRLDANRSRNPKWYKFTSQKGKFSILMPGIPKGSNPIAQAKPEIVKKVKARAFVLNVRQGDDISSYLVQYAKYPSGHTRTFVPYDFLERTWENNFRDLKNKLVYKKRISLKNFAGIEFQYKDQGRTKSLITAQYYLVNDYTYLITAITSPAGLRAGYADKYLQSFELLK